MTSSDDRPVAERESVAAPTDRRGDRPADGTRRRFRPPASWRPQQRRRRRRPGASRRGWPYRSPAVGLPLLVFFALATAFFAWVSAEPVWLAAGRGDHGTVTVGTCTGSGIAQRCVGTFTAQRYTVDVVSVTGTGAPRRRPGAVLPARMVGPDGRTAYAGDPAGLHWRWTLGLLLVVCCAMAMAGVTGAWRLDGRARYGAVAVSVTFPLLLTATILAAAF